MIIKLFMIKLCLLFSIMLCGFLNPSTSLTSELCDLIIHTYTDNELKSKNSIPYDQFDFERYLKTFGFKSENNNIWELKAEKEICEKMKDYIKNEYSVKIDLNKAVDFIENNTILKRLSIVENKKIRWDNFKKYLVVYLIEKDMVYIDGTKGEPIGPYYISKVQFVQLYWYLLTGKNPSYHKFGLFRPKYGYVKINERVEIRTLYPVERINRYIIDEVIKKLCNLSKTNKYQLPNEEQWEHAARAGRKTRYYYADDESMKFDDNKYFWHYFNSYANDTKRRGRRTHPVGQLTANDFGLYDMFGNVWEFNREIYSYGDFETDYIYGRTKNFNEDQQYYSVIRGGSWDTPGGCMFRKFYRRDHKYNSVGFRLSRAP